MRQIARAFFSAGQVLEAVAPFKEIVRLAPESAEAHFDLGAVYARCGRFVEAAGSFRKALELRPSFHAALAQLAHALEYWKRDSELLDAYRKLSRTADSPRDKLAYLAKAQVMEERLEYAEATLRRLLVLSPDDGRTRVHPLGQVLIDQRRFEEASGELLRAIDTVPAAFQKLAAARRMTEADRPLLARMDAKAAEPALDSESKTLIQFGLGKAFDDIGDHEEAIRRYNGANALRARSAHSTAPQSSGATTTSSQATTRKISPRLRIGGLCATKTTCPFSLWACPAPARRSPSRSSRPIPQSLAGGELQFWRGRGA